MLLRHGAHRYPTMSRTMRLELTNNDFTQTGPRSSLTSKCGPITRTKPDRPRNAHRHRHGHKVSPPDTTRNAVTPGPPNEGNDNFPAPQRRNPALQMTTRLRRNDIFTESLQPSPIAESARRQGLHRPSTREGTGPTGSGAPALAMLSAAIGTTRFS